MITFSKEPWFKSWIQNSVLTMNFDKAKGDMERVTGISLSSEEEEYYRYVLQKMYPKVLDVCNLNYDKELVEKNKEEKLGKKLLRLRYTISDKLIDLKNLPRRKQENPDDGR